MQNIAQWNALLKRYYTNQKIQDLTIKGHVLLSYFIKDEGAHSEQQLPVLIGAPVGVSSDFNIAQNNANGSTSKAWMIELYDQFGNIQIDHKLIKVSNDNKKAFLSARKVETERLLKKIGRRINIHGYRDGSGAVAGLKSTSPVTGSTITLRNPKESVFFELNEEVNFIEVGVGVRQEGGSNGVRKITAINRQAGTVTFNSTVNALSLAVTDLICYNGDYNNVAPGLEAWLSASSTTATPFFGVDRTVDVQRLGGLELSGVGRNIDELLVDAVYEVQSEGGEPDLIILNNAKMTELVQGQASKVMLKNDESPKLGCKSVMVLSPAGDIRVAQDIDCPFDRGFVLQTNTWVLFSAGALVEIFSEDGVNSLRVYNKNAIENRATSYYAFCCTAPGFNLKIKF